MRNASTNWPTMTERSVRAWVWAGVACRSAEPSEGSVRAGAWGPGS